MEFMGYRRADGRVGVRNHILVMPTVQCANQVCEMIDREVPEATAVPHVYGCSFDVHGNAILDQTLINFATDPNVFAVLLVSLGCETVDAAAVGAAIAARGTRVELISIQGAGGTVRTLEQGKRVVAGWAAELPSQRREPADFSELILGVECGGSDAFSGLSANPVTGAAADWVVAAGGTVLLSETTEVVGAEHLLGERCAAPAVRDALYAAVAASEEGFALSSPESDGIYITPGNIAGGLTTIAEKSLGCILKGGSTTLREVIGYAERPAERGLVFMNTPGYDISSVTGLVAGGAQIVIFTTGRGTPTGCAIAPVIKVSSNSEISAWMADNIDFNAGTVIDGTESIAAAGCRLFDFTAEVASGRTVAAEQFGHHEFAVAAPGIRHCRQDRF